MDSGAPPDSDHRDSHLQLRALSHGGSELGVQTVGFLLFATRPRERRDGVILPCHRSCFADDGSGAVIPRSIHRGHDTFRWLLNQSGEDGWSEIHVLDVHLRVLFEIAVSK